MTDKDQEAIDKEFNDKIVEDFYDFWYEAAQVQKGKPLRWDADMVRLFEWYHTCPKPWNPHWYESEVGGVTLHITRPSREDNGDT